ncbi:MAG: tryptophan halogenase family protein [Thalassotalea sp.]
MQKSKKIVIVGGGTAGWMTANILAYSFRDANISISLVESPEVGIIGVGEGSTPALRNFFDLLNIKESDWMPACNATYKAGIRFNDWSTVKGYESYFHPFPSTLDVHTQKSFFYNAQLRATGIDLSANPNDFYITAQLTEQHKKPIANDNFPFEIDYAYHFDANLLGQYLKKVAIGNGVNHIIGHVNEVVFSNTQNSNNQHSNTYDINAVALKNGEQISGDFFIDCTGFKGLLINQLPGVEFISYADELHNDSAIAMSTPLTGETMAAQTVSTALKYGWAWQIPLTNRYGNGYVYSSKYVNKADAEQELKAHLKIDDNQEVRHLSFKLGRNNKHWQNNCLAVGLSQGFIEPLEATALLLIQQTIGKFVSAYKQGDFSNSYQGQFNQQINNDFDGIKDYIVLHYTLNSRNDTRYWQDNHKHLTNMSARLKELVKGWHAGLDVSQLVHKLALHEHYPIPSWYAILAGYGYFPAELKAPTSQNNTHGFKQSQNFLSRCSLNFPAYTAT